MNIIIITLLIVLITIGGGFFALKFKDKLHLILGFSAGTIMGVTLFDLIPESLNLAKNVEPQQVLAYTALGFVIYLAIDRFFSLHGSAHCENCENPHHEQNKLGASAIILHSFLDGLGIGLAFKVSSSIGWIVAIAVLAHKFSDGINTVGIIMRNKTTQKEAYRWLFLDALAPVLGVIASLFINISELTLGILLSIFAGLFLYIGASDLIPESHHKHPTIWTTAMTIFGIALMYFVVRFAK